MPALLVGLLVVLGADVIGWSNRARLVFLSRCSLLAHAGKTGQCVRDSAFVCFRLVLGTGLTVSFLIQSLPAKKARVNGCRLEGGEHL